ncbi:MAG: hypothetical protein GX760_04065 [Erysipelothrix sp.]|nr:hypothetical protein [Erysipelothrix sp.]
MAYKISETWLMNYQEENLKKQVGLFLEDYRSYLSELPGFRQRQECISKMNHFKRADYWSCQDMEMDVRVGDICYTDFGIGYINECSYQHFGLITSVINHKAYIIPMTSNHRTVRQAKKGTKDHLFYIGQPAGLNRETCAFINDGRFINTARIISVNAHIDSSSETFSKLIDVVIACFYDKM